MRKKFSLSFSEIEERYKKESLERVKKGYPIKFKRTKPREEFKEKTLVEFWIRTTPPAKEILSGKAFSKLFRED